MEDQATSAASSTVGELYTQDEPEDDEEEDEPLPGHEHEPVLSPDPSIAGYNQREAALVMKLGVKEQELHELRAYISQLVDFRSASKTYERFAFADPAINFQFNLMREKIKTLEKQLKETKEELDAVQFHPDSVTGKKLLAKCRTLQNENEELGKQLSQGRVQQLEIERDLLKHQKNELKHSLDEAHQWIEEMEEEREQMYAQIYLLKKQVECATKVEKKESKSADEHEGRRRDERSASVHKKRSADDEPRRSSKRSKSNDNSR